MYGKTPTSYAKTLTTSNAWCTALNLQLLRACTTEEQTMAIRCTEANAGDEIKLMAAMEVELGSSKQPIPCLLTTAGSNVKGGYKARGASSKHNTVVRALGCALLLASSSCMPKHSSLQQSQSPTIASAACDQSVTQSMTCRRRGIRSYQYKLAASTLRKARAQPAMRALVVLR